ncbi:MAG: Trk system potassium transporter TrkA [Phycisphaeraceae bacterium]
MNIVISGAGDVGRHAAEVLGGDGHNITIIDRDLRKLVPIEDVLDVRTLHGNGADAQVLREAGCVKADLYIAATDIDEINLLSASIAAGLGVKRTIARVHHGAYFERRGIDYARHFGVDHLVCPEHTTAVAIAQTLRNPGALAVERFARGMIEMLQLAVSAEAPVVGQVLSEIALPRSVRLAVVERDRTVFIPDADTVIRSGDIVTLVGETGGFDKVNKLFQIDADRRKKIMIMGGTPLSVWLCRALRGRMFSVRLFEWDRARAEELSAKLDWVTVLRVDPMDADTMTLERIDQADAFVTATADDEHNMLAAARAKSMGAKSAIAVLQRTTYLHLLKHVGIDKAFSPRSTAVAEIRRLLSDPAHRMASLAEGVADILEVRVPETARKVIGVPLKDLTFPGHSIVAAIQRGDKVRVPGAADTIAAGDTVVLIAPAGAEKQIKSVFSVK